MNMKLYEFIDKLLAISCAISTIIATGLVAIISNSQSIAEASLPVILFISIIVHASISDSISEYKSKKATVSRKTTPKKVITEQPKIKTKTDINNSSLEELRALPFINTALAKRIIKKREEINGFKSIEDVCLYLKFNTEKSIKFREHICLNPREIPLTEQKNDERSVDW